MESYIGVIWALGFKFVPRNWASCSGSLLPIGQYQALFSLIGDIYGGDARTIFGLPDLRGRSPIGVGTGPGLPTFPLGLRIGESHHALTTAQLPPHTHTHSYSGNNGATGIDVTVEVAAQNGETPIAADGDYLGAPATNFGVGENLYVPEANVTTKVELGGVSTTGTGTSFNNNLFNINETGAGTPFSLYHPIQVINYCICLEGLYPARS